MSGWMAGRARERERVGERAIKNRKQQTPIDDEPFKIEKIKEKPAAVIIDFSNICSAIFCTRISIF